MKPVTMAVLGFLVSLTAYGMIGYSWIAYNAQFSLSSINSANAASIIASIASQVQWATIVAFLGAVATAGLIFVLESKRPSLNHPQTRQEILPENRETRTITITTRALLRAGSILAGLISLTWGLSVVVAVELAATSSAFTPSNPFTNSSFVLSSMFEAMAIGLFAVLLAILSR